jgi:hypothetical protein
VLHKWLVGHWERRTHNHMSTGTHFEIKIERNGMWPFYWRWSVMRDEIDERGQSTPSAFAFRFGEATTKDRARRKALKVRRSLEEDDVRVVW